MKHEALCRMAVFFHLVILDEDEVQEFNPNDNRNDIGSEEAGCGFSGNRRPDKLPFGRILL